MPASHLTDIVQGIADIDRLKDCDAVLSGYIGSPEQGSHILAAVAQVKQANPDAWYFVIRSWGTPKRVYCGTGVAEFFCNEALPASDMIAPNLLELEQLSGERVENVEQAVQVARSLCARGQSRVSQAPEPCRLPC